MQGQLVFVSHVSHNCSQWNESQIKHHVPFLQCDCACISDYTSFCLQWICEVACIDGEPTMSGS